MRLAIGAINVSGTNVQAPMAPHSLRELAEILVRHHDLHEGRYELIIEFKMSFGSMGPSAAEALPGAMLGVSAMGLVPATTPDDLPHIVDAAVVNPKKKTRKPVSAKK